MSLTINEVEHIAKLAHLELSAEEKARYREQLSDILDHIAKLSELDTSGISPMANVVEGASPIRADEARPSLPREKILQNAQSTQDGQYKVPAVFGGQK